MKFHIIIALFLISEPLWALPAQPISAVATPRKIVALTFDACQTPQQQPGYAGDIINTLKRTHTPATLFLGGLWVKSHPEIVTALGKDPLFELGNHSWSHPDFRTLTPGQIQQEITKTNDAITARTGQPVRFFRYPFGYYNQQSLAAVKQAKMMAIQWSVVTADPWPAATANYIVNMVKQQTRPGSIIIMHMNGRGVHTAAALPRIITWLKSHGYHCVTLSQLMAMP